MAAIHVVLFVLTSCCRCLCEDVALDDTKSAFVDILRKDLRRNNDDYVESTAGTLNVTNPYLRLSVSSSDSPKTAETGLFVIEADPASTHEGTNGRNKRRALNSDMAEPISLSAQENDFNETNPQERYSSEPVRATARPATRAKQKAANDETATMQPRFRSNAKQPKTIQPFGIPLKVLTTMMPFPSLVLNAEQVKQEKLIKFKKFIQKNKELFDEFVHKQRQQADPKTIVRASDPRSPYLRKKKLRSSKVNTVIPELNPRQLDMAPAKGAMVHAMRSRNRLCQRSILIPEGPKYNSRGQVYLGEFGHQSGKDFSKTKKPHLLLPRCCNCCKKSVLGCE